MIENQKLIKQKDELNDKLTNKIEIVKDLENIKRQQEKEINNLMEKLN